MTVEYKIISYHWYLHTLEDAVNAACEQGWIPVGPPVVVPKDGSSGPSQTYAQALVREANRYECKED